MWKYFLKYRICINVQKRLVSVVIDFILRKPYITFTAHLSKILPVKTIWNTNLNTGCLKTGLDVNLKAHCKIMAVKCSTFTTILMAFNLKLMATNKWFGKFSGMKNPIIRTLMAIKSPFRFMKAMIMTWFQIDSNNTNDLESNIKKKSWMAMIVEFNSH